MMWDRFSSASLTSSARCDDVLVVGGEKTSPVMDDHDFMMTLQGRKIEGPDEPTTRGRQF